MGFRLVCPLLNLLFCCVHFCDFDIKFLSADGGRRAWFRAERYLGIIALFALGALLGALAVPKLGIHAIWCSCALLAVSLALMFEKHEPEHESKTEWT